MAVPLDRSVRQGKVRNENIETVDGYRVLGVCFIVSALWWRDKRGHSTGVLLVDRYDKLGIVMERF